MYDGRRKLDSGFTLVELLVVIVAIGILTTLVTISFLGVSKKAVVASLQSDLTSVSKILKMDQVLNSSFPTTLASANEGKGFQASPGNALTYQYDNSKNPQTFCVTANNGSIYYSVTDDGTPVEGPCLNFTATGGTIADIDGYRIHTFKNSGDFITSGENNVEVLVVGGGGGGAAMTGGGGGAGGVVYESSHHVTAKDYTVVVGNGGSGEIGSNNPGNGSDGQNSVFDNITAIGGGGAGTNSGTGRLGGSGGGAGHNNTQGGHGTVGQGHDGSGGATTAPNYGAGGGGGAGQNGGVPTNLAAGNGGNGLIFSISGSAVYYAGGGGGGTYYGGVFGIGGLGGGGSAPSGDGMPNTGGGGAGQINNLPNAGDGGSGVVILRYLLN